MMESLLSLAFTLAIVVVVALALVSSGIVKVNFRSEKLNDIFNPVVAVMIPRGHFTIQDTMGRIMGYTVTTAAKVRRHEVISLTRDHLMFQRQGLIVTASRNSFDMK